MLEQTFITVSILLFSVALQSTVGFGLGMVSIPMLLWQGHCLSHSVFLGLAVSLFSSLAAGSAMGDQLPWRTSAVASGFRVVGLLPGLALAHATAGMSAATLKGVIGLVIGLGVAAQAIKMMGHGPKLAEGAPPSPRLAPFAFLASGVLTGWIGMGGPPLVFWQLTGRSSAKETRGFLFGVYTLTLPFQLAVMLCQDPQGIASLFPVLAISLPLSWLVSQKALKVGDRMSVTRLQWASLVFLALLALRSMADWALAVA